MGLKINTKKAEFITYNISKETAYIKVDNINIKKIEDLKCLGSNISTTARDLKVRTSERLQRGMLSGHLEKLWMSKTTLSIEVKIFKGSVLSVFLYGSESWVLAEALLKKACADAFASSCWCTNEEIVHIYILHKPMERSWERV